MAGEVLRNTALSKAIVDLVGDVSDLAAKEVRLAKAELRENVQAKVQASVWLVAAALLSFLALALVLEAAVFALASIGLAIHWACLVVAAFLAVLAAVGVAHGRSVAHQSFTPDRSVNQIREDIRTAKEVLS